MLSEALTDAEVDSLAEADGSSLSDWLTLVDADLLILTLVL